MTWFPRFWQWDNLAENYEIVKRARTLDFMGLENGAGLSDHESEPSGEQNTGSARVFDIRLKSR